MSEDASKEGAQSPLAVLGHRQATAIAPLVGIGRQSGDALVGLDNVRRAKRVAYIFASQTLARRTLAELARRAGPQTRVFAVEQMDCITGVFGGEGVSVVGIKAGSLAEGIGRRLGDGGKLS